MTKHSVISSLSTIFSSAALLIATSFPAYAISGPVGLNQVRTEAGPGAGQVTLNWSRYSPVVDNYKIFYGTKSGTYQYATSDIGNNVVESIGYLTPGVRYYFLIKGYSQGNPLPLVSPEVSEIASSAQKAVVGTAGPYGPRALTAVSGPASGQVALTWRTLNPDTRSFSVVYGVQPGVYIYGALNAVTNTSQGALNSFTVGALNPGQRYYFAVVPQGGTLSYSSAEVSQVARR